MNMEFTYREAVEESEDDDYEDGDTDTEGDARVFWGNPGSGILFQRKSDGKVLLTLRSGTMQSGTWSIPGGKVDEGEDPKASAIREAEEELQEPLPKGKFTGRKYIFKMKITPGVDLISGEWPRHGEKRPPYGGMRYVRDGENEFRYITYLYNVDDDQWRTGKGGSFNWESKRAQWFDPGKPPKNTLVLHGARAVDEMLKNLPAKPPVGKVEETFADFMESCP
jgi:8-oxo-dGTP pyrophosphatase MutT (NUDIX family)